jgi:hypothetical protein
LVDDFYVGLHRGDDIERFTYGLFLCLHLLLQSFNCLEFVGIGGFDVEVHRGFYIRVTLAEKFLIGLFGVLGLLFWIENIFLV